MKELQEKRGQLAAEVKRMADAFNAQGEKWKDGDERAAWEKVNGELDAVNAQLEQQRTAAEVALRAKHAAESMGGPPADDSQPGERSGAGKMPGTIYDRAIALQAWMRAGEQRELSAEHTAACERLNVDPNKRYFDLRFSPVAEKRVGLDVATSGAGKETIPPGFMPELEKALSAYGGPRSVARVVRTDSGNSIVWPTVDDTGNTGALLAEATTIGASVDPTFASKTLLAYKYSSKAILISSELLEDSAFQMATEIGSLLGERLGRITGTHFTTGDNSSKPQGVVAGASAGVTAAGATSIDPDELLSLIHSVDPAYRSSANCVFMMHDGIALHLRKKKDANGQYIWQDGMQAGEPARLFGYPVVINQHMQATVAAETVTVLFGDFSKYVIRDVASVRAYRLDERYRDTDQTGFVTFSRHDGRYLNTAAVKKLTMA